MLNAKYARQISDTVAAIACHEVIAKVMREVLEECVSSRNRNYIYFDFGNKPYTLTAYKHVEQIRSVLVELGYQVELDDDKENEGATLTIRW